MADLIVCNLAALCVAGLYYYWRDWYAPSLRLRREAVMRERVTYMLWVSVNRSKSNFCM